MLQFIAEYNEKYSIAEQVQMAIEGGCGWVILNFADHPDDAFIRETAAEVVPLCREAGIILTIADNADMARELGIHGVWLTDGSRSASSVRAQLGAEAIIGASAGDVAALRLFADNDIDYATADARRLPSLVSDAANAGITLPVVLTGDYDASDIDFIRNTGASGVATGRKLLDAEDPVAAIERMLSLLAENK